VGFLVSLVVEVVDCTCVGVGCAMGIVDFFNESFILLGMIVFASFDVLPRSGATNNLLSFVVRMERRRSKVISIKG
jgi:hypothetical protein